MTDDLEQWLQLLAHPVRRSILWLVWDAPMAATDIADEFEIAPNTVSTHLARLVEAGFLTVDVRGTSRFYRAHPPSVGMVHAALDAAFGYRLSSDRPFGTGLRSAPIAGPVLVECTSPVFVPRRETDWLELATAQGIGRLVEGAEASGSMRPMGVLTIGTPASQIVVRTHRHGSAGVVASYAWGTGEVPLPPGVASITLVQERHTDGHVLRVLHRSFATDVALAAKPWIDVALRRSAILLAA